MKWKHFSMFSGIGGFELGMQQAYDNRMVLQESCNKDNRILSSSEKSKAWLSCVGFSEIDKYAIQIYKHHFGGHKNYGNARDIRTEELPDFDLLVGGFPCQAFSIAGRRKGFEDTRGTLFFEIARIAKSKRPRYLLLENVKGLLNHDKGQTFRVILETLRELGYSIDYGVLNSRYFGVPQNRERVFIVGSLGGELRGKVFPLSVAAGENRGQVASTGIIQLNQPTHSNNRVYSPDGLSPSLNTMQGGRRQPFVQAVLTPDRAEKKQNGRRFKEDGEPSFTLTGQDIHGVAMNQRIRRLTPLECERLQGFPDGWTEGLSDTQRYKCLGNAVTVNVVEAIMERMGGG